jgi:Leucine-rich repeat (LRR) protein
MMLPLLFLLAAEVDLTHSWITDADLARIARENPSVRKIDLSHTKITDAGLEHLRNLRDVRELRLYYAEYISADGIAHLRGWKNLEVLNLRGARVNSKVFDHLAHLTALRELDLGFTEIDDDGFDQLVALPKLEKLAIGGNRLNGSCLAVIKQLVALRDLDAGGIQRVDSGLWGLALSEANLARLGSLTQLRRLSVAAATINDRGVDKPGHPEAERAELRDLSALAGLKQLEYLDLTRQPLTPAALKSLEGIGSLRELRLGLVKNVEPAMLPKIAGLKKIYLNGSWLEP